MRVSVNVSSRYLNHGNIVDDVRSGLATHRSSADCLILEVTESLLLENSAQLEQTFQELKLLGVRLALDDFGTGYSSLAYLHRFPIDILKIDRSFVERLAGERDGAEASTRWRWRAPSCRWPTRSGSTRWPKASSIDAQRDTLLELGCKTGQGYLLRQGHADGEVLDAAVTRRRDLLAGNLAGPDRILGDRPISRVIVSS